MKEIIQPGKPEIPPDVCPHISGPVFTGNGIMIIFQPCIKEKCRKYPICVGLSETDQTGK